MSDRQAGKNLVEHQRRGVVHGCARGTLGIWNSTALSPDRLPVYLRSYFVPVLRVTLQFGSGKPELEHYPEC